MNRLSVSFLLTVILCGAAAQAEAPKETTAKTAEIYRRAFALLPEAVGADGDGPILPKAQQRLGDHHRRRVSQCAAALKQMHRAAAKEGCNWRHPENGEGLEMELPHLDQVRRLAQMAALRVRLRLADGDGKGAVSDFVALMRMARHLGHEGVLIEKLVAFSLQDMARDALASDLGLAVRSVDEAPLEGAVQKLYPTLKEMEATLRAERVFMVRAAEKQLLGRGAANQNAELAGEMINRLVVTYDQSIHAFVMPYPKAMKWLKDQEEAFAVLEAKKQKEDLLVGMMMPALSAARKVQARAEIRHAMFHAALAYARGGAADAAKVVDPISGKPFQVMPLEKAPGWIGLRSALKFDDKPVVFRAKVR